MADEGGTQTSWTMAGINTSVDLDGGVLVGDDGSHAAFEAMRYAAAEAARRGTDLHVLRAWTIPTAVRPDDVPFGVTPSAVEFQDATRAATRRRAAAAAADHPEVTVHAHTVFGRADRALIAAARGADILVVGSRGRSKITSLLLGSTAATAIREATIPVIVVR